MENGEERFSQKGPLKIQPLFDVSALNTIWTMLAGNRFSLNDKRLLKLLDLVHAGFRLVDMTGGKLNQMPFLRFVAPTWSGYKSLKAIIDEILEFLKVRCCSLKCAVLPFFHKFPFFRRS